MCVPACLCWNIVRILYISHSFTLLCRERERNIHFFSHLFTEVGDKFHVLYCYATLLYSEIMTIVIGKNRNRLSFSCVFWCCATTVLWCCCFIPITHNQFREILSWYIQFSSDFDYVMFTHSSLSDVECAKKEKKQKKKSN